MPIHKGITLPTPETVGTSNDRNEAYRLLQNPAWPRSRQPWMDACSGATCALNATRAGFCKSLGIDKLSTRYYPVATGDCIAADRSLRGPAAVVLGGVSHGGLPMRELTLHGMRLTVEGKKMKTGFLVTFIAAATACVSAFGEPVDTFERLMAQGDGYHEEFDNRKALSAYKAAYKLRPEDPEVVQKLAWSYNNVGEDLDSEASEPYFEKAAAYAEKLKTLAADDPVTYFLLAMNYGNLALYRGGKEKVRLSRDVEKNARKAIELDPDYSRPYAVLGVYYREVATLNWVLKMFAQHLLGGLPEGTLTQSENMFLKAIDKDPGNVYAQYQLGLTYEELDKKDKALEQYRKVLALPIIDHRDPYLRKQAGKRIDKLK